VKAPTFVLLALVLAGAFACGPKIQVPVRVEMPGVSPFPVHSFDEIALADFREDAPLEDFKAGRELREYLATEIDQAFDGTVLRIDSPDESRVRGRERGIVLSGSISLATEIRKALDKTRVPADGPFKTAGRGLLEYRRYTLTVDLLIQSASDGSTLYQRRFREERDYSDLEKSVEFAFSDLSSRVRATLFPLLLATPTFEARTLLRR
jgi:hypothetical protein